MRWKQLIELTKVNLIYANPQVLEKKRKQEAEGKQSKLSAPMTVLGQSLLILVLFSYLYGTMLGGFDFTLYPGYFSFFILTFVMLTLLQGFYIIYNLFYDSKDLLHYLPMPFKSSEVFLAKFVVVILTVVPYLAPSFSIMYSLGRDAGLSVGRTLLTGLVNFLILTMVVFLLDVILVHLISRLSVFQKYRKAAITGMYAIASIGMIAIILLVSNTATTDVYFETIPDYAEIPFLSFLYPMMLQPFGQEAMIGFAAWLLVLAVLVFLVWKIVLPGIYEESEGLRAQPSMEKKVKSGTQKSTSIEQTLLKYNFSLIQDSTLMMQYLSSNIVVPIMMMGSLVINTISLADLSVSTWWGLVFLIGFVYSLMTLTSLSIVGVIISLERENFLFIKSLPFSLKFYLKKKFWFAFAVQLLLPLVISLGVMLMLKLPWLLLLSFWAGLGVGIYTLSEQYFVRDYKYLNLQWQNITELFSRGGGNFIQAIRLFGALALGAAVCVIAAIVLLAVPPIWQSILSLLFILVPLAITVWRTKHYQKKFWHQLD